MANIELLDEVIAYIEKHPEEWRQTTWGSATGKYPILDEDGYIQPGPTCGTAFCIAGHVARMKATKVRWFKPFLRDEALIISSVVDDNGEQLSVSDFARDQLELTQSEADFLFSAFNTLKEIKRMRDKLANGQRIYPFE